MLASSFLKNLRNSIKNGEKGEVEKGKKSKMLGYLNMKQALILAAGIGKRLGNLTKDTPKCLLEIEKDKTLIDFELETLKENNINEIIIVTGFKRKKLEDSVIKKWQDFFSFRFIFNERFDEYNNIYSAYLAKDFWDDETILLNSDIIFHPKIFTNLKTKNGSFLVIDDTKELTIEDMKVKINSKGEIKEISKALDTKASHGEYIGITCLRGFEREKFLESLEKNVKNKRLDIYYEDALADILSEISVYAVSTDGLPWTEVDTLEDYNKAKNILQVTAS